MHWRGAAAEDSQMDLVLDQHVHDACVLMVDDQASNIASLKMVLREAGYARLLSTTDSREALPLYLEHRPDLVLLDLQMPHLDGFEVMRQLMAAEPDSYAPILVLTADVDPEVRCRALTAGARDFLHKPFDKTETLVRIRNLIEVRLLHKTVRRHNEVLEQTVMDRTRELHDTQRGIIHRLGNAAEYKDNETGQHNIRMSLYSRVIGRALGMSSNEQEMLLWASPMHDVGKIGIPDRVLLKPGRLDPYESAVMQTHAAIGADLLSGSKSPLIQMASVIAGTHHEKWDGSGYPNGMKGEDTPMVGRICAVSDVFDALTSQRPYKKAWPVEAAVAEIVRGRGHHFDPDLVDLFTQNLDEILQIRSQYAAD